ncbi:hypothetical protein ILUMI_18353 [Ignelater luminosus]|uniref:Fatty acid desaturase domain-containing protein n=1 Tax=Ignelater luminosus TaxID=2038154 RepID=A0A8K0G0Z5_IGNLU|nr:hypothetical protein ILUMI_18353 [Ignelater luminosus]
MKTDVTTDILLVIAFILSVLATFYWNYEIAVFAGIFVSFVALASHNYFHQKDNFRMYYSDITLMQSGEWRIIHVLSHHLYTNTIADMQAYAVEPIVQYFPHEKSFVAKYCSWVYAPIILWPTLVCYLFIVRMYQWLMLGYYKQVCKTDLVAAILPSTMYLLGGQSLLHTLGMWLFIIIIHSFWYLFLGVIVTHFHPDVFFDGDEPRPKHQLDWGISQLDTTSDRYEVMGNHLLSLITFGDHAVHHLFPTLDQAVLEHLYPVVGETMKQFNLNLRMKNHFDMVFGYFRRMAIDKPNVNPPDLLKSGTLF